MFPYPVRDDISDSLIHLTGERNGVSARDALLSILVEGRIRASGKEGFVKGNTRAVCFTEAPFKRVPDIIRHRKHHSRPFGEFGIIIAKQSAWDAGARPVLYLPDDEGTWIPEEEKWRHVRFEPPGVDFTNEREWRLPGELLLTKLPFKVIVKSPYHANELLNGLEESISAEAAERINQLIQYVYES